jgi:hypothetical protein
MFKQALGVLGGAGLGAGLMYVLDPDKGERRRALVRHKANRVLRKGGKAARKTSRDLGKQARVLIVEAGSKLREGGLNELLANLRAVNGGKNRSELLGRNAIGATLGAISLSLLAQNLIRRGHA